MTDTFQAVDQALIDRKSFEKEAVWLPTLAVHHFNAGKIGIEDKVFTDCRIEGPAVLMILDGVDFDSCTMGATDRAENLLFRPLGDKLTGVVPVRNCKFLRCQFVRIAYTGSPHFLENFGGGIRSLTGVLQRVAAANGGADEGSAS